MVYFGNISDERINEIIVEIATKGIDSRTIVNKDYLPVFLARENLSEGA